VRTSKLLLSDIGLFTGVSSDKSPGDSLLFKQSALRGVSYALTSISGLGKAIGTIGHAQSSMTLTPIGRALTLPWKRLKMP
jgi:hypothetical protein